MNRKKIHDSMELCEWKSSVANNQKEKSIAHIKQQKLQKIKAFNQLSTFFFLSSFLASIKMLIHSQHDTRIKWVTITTFYAFLWRWGTNGSWLLICLAPSGTKLDVKENWKDIRNTFLPSGTSSSYRAHK